MNNGYLLPERNYPDRHGENMNPEVKKITDRNIMYDYLKNVFVRKPVFLKTKDFNIETESFTFNENGIVFKTSEQFQDEVVNLYVRNGMELDLARAKIISSSAGDYKCDVYEILIMNVPRKEQRAAVGGDNTPGQKIYISGIISDFTLKMNFEDNRKKITAFRDDFEEKLGKKYARAKIYIISEQKLDARMDYFSNEKKPYFIRDITEKPDENDEQHKYYVNVIYPENRDQDKRLISEIAVPFLYKYMLPFGYLRVNGMKPLTDDDYSALKKTGMNISTYFTNDKTYIRSATDTIPITDISMTGFGVVFKERSLIKYFKENSCFIMTAFLPGNKSSTALSQVKNISIMKNGIYRVGCSIMNFDPIGEVNYMEYLESCGISTDS